ncbi:nardilysin-like [Eudromia elegans]
MRAKPVSGSCRPQLPPRREVSPGEGAGALRSAHEEGQGLRFNRGDPDIVKSPSDPKQYRYIKLQNGLHALLISDINNMEEESSEEEDSTESETESDDSSDSGADMEDDEESYDNKIDKDNAEEDHSDSDMEIEELTGKEESEAELTEKEESEAEQTEKDEEIESTDKLSAAALCVGVGSFCDPEDLPGLAHFLEHMVFMGSLKYPDENGFDAFLRKHGGSDNASTDCERTVFHFDIQQQYFKEALDRWAQFFIHPLMIRDAIDREIEAIDSEYQLAKPSDKNRQELLLGSLARPGYPMRKFFWGNAQTLKHEPRKSNIDIYIRLKDFWQSYYSAHYMNLVVQSKETLDTLENWVTEIFSQIPNNGLPQPSFGHLTEPFDTPEFHKLYRVIPVRNIHQLHITWALPPQEKNYRVKPLHYISWLVGHEGKGSILYFLRKKFWAVALCGGNSETGFEQNSSYSIFNISITLTGEGYEHFYEVVHVVFQYLRMLQKVGPDKRIWEEIQKIDENEFYFQDETDPIDYIENISEHMHLFHKQDFLTGDQLLFEYNPEVINDILGLLCPQRANLCLLSAANEGRCPLKERWFETPYSVEDIDEYWADVWACDFELNWDLHLPEENKYIATDFSLRAPDFPKMEYPVKILNIPQGCMWYKNDKKFKKPKGTTVCKECGASRDFCYNLTALFSTSILADPGDMRVPEKLRFTPLAHSCPVQFRVVDLPNAHLLCKVKTLNKNDANSEVTVYYQAGARSIRECVLMELLVTHMEEPCFNFLRTKETLGYHVYPACRNNSGIIGFSITVTTQATKNNSEFVDKKIEEFLLHFEEKMKLLTEDTFRAQVSALINIKECEDCFLGEEVDRNWNEVMSQQYLFDRLACEIEALKSFTKADLVEWLQTLRGNYRKILSIHVVGYGEQEQDSEFAAVLDVQRTLLGELPQLTFLPPSSYMKNTAFIRHISDFTLTLNLLPYHKILK